MQTEWFMLMAMGYAGTVRAGVTARLRQEEAEASILEMLQADPDAERVHLLRSQVSETGLRKWIPVSYARRSAPGRIIPPGER